MIGAFKRELSVWFVRILEGADGIARRDLIADASSSNSYIPAKHVPKTNEIAWNGAPRSGS